MRWPLRFQILLPLVGVLLATLTAVSGINAYLSVRDAKEQIQRQLRSVAHTLVNSRFPLTDGVLRQAGGLSGAEFVVTTEDGKVASSSRPGFPAVLPDQAVQQLDDIRLDESKTVDGEEFFHTAIRRSRRGFETGPVLLHIFYPVQTYRAAWRHAVLPPLILGCIAILIAVPLGIAIASHVSRPIGRLRRQVNQIAEGNFQPMTLSRHDDEILDLGRSVNRMAEMLSRYEAEVRRSERLKTLGQLGGGIAHQMRNSATGCRMALDLHMRESPAAAESENLEVAVRQLMLMERYLKRFLSMQTPASKPHVESDMAELVDNVLPLVRPAARHVGVELCWTPPSEPMLVRGDPDAIEQLLVNLLLNAIDAASRRDESTAHHAAGGTVDLRLRWSAGSTLLLEIEDTGAGPPPEIGNHLFEPLVTGRIDGTGLGLSVVRDICEQHDGSIRWERRDGKTCFVVELPRVHVENRRVEAVSR